MSRSIARSAAVLVVLLFIAVVGSRLWQVHSETGDWQVTWPEKPSVLHELGRDYRRSDSAPRANRLISLDTRTVHSPGGRSVVFIPPGSNGAVPTVIWLLDSQGEQWAYELQGGP